jgi:hypothetical protein
MEGGESETEIKDETTMPTGSLVSGSRVVRIATPLGVPPIAILKRAARLSTGSTTDI